MARSAQTSNLPALACQCFLALALAAQTFHETDVSILRLFYVAASLVTAGATFQQLPALDGGTEGVSGVSAADAEGDVAETGVASVSLPLVSSHGDGGGDAGSDGARAGGTGKVGVASECQVVRCRWRST